eukprot:7938_1
MGLCHTKVTTENHTQTNYEATTESDNSYSKCDNDVDDIQVEIKHYWQELSKPALPANSLSFTLPILSNDETLYFIANHPRFLSVYRLFKYDLTQSKCVCITKIPEYIQFQDWKDSKFAIYKSKYIYMLCTLKSTLYYLDLQSGKWNEWLYKNLVEIDVINILYYIPTPHNKLIGFNNCEQLVFNYDENKIANMNKNVDQLPLFDEKRIIFNKRRNMLIVFSVETNDIFYCDLNNYEWMKSINKIPSTYDERKTVHCVSIFDIFVIVNIDYSRMWTTIHDHETFEFWCLDLFHDDINTAKWYKCQPQQFTENLYLPKFIFGQDSCIHCVNLKYSMAAGLYGDLKQIYHYKMAINDIIPIQLHKTFQSILLLFVSGWLRCTNWQQYIPKDIIILIIAFVYIVPM